ncbi:MAG TPA: hypothetical protein VIV60_36645 [Polyangiaceae bacterium]
MCRPKLAIATLLLALVALLGCAHGGLTTEQLVLRDAQVSMKFAADTIETLQTTAVILYRVEQMTQVQIASDAHESREQVVTRVAVVRQRWVDVWQAFDEARSIYETTAALLAMSPQPTPAAIQSAVDKQSVALAKVQSLLSIARQRNSQGVAQ